VVERTAFRFAGPEGMKVSWQLPSGRFHDHALAAPTTANLGRGRTYRLRLGEHPRFPGRTFYPTLEVLSPSEQARTYLGHCSVPVSFTEYELAVAAEGRLVTKVIVLVATSGEDATTQEFSSVRDGGVRGNPYNAAPDGAVVLAVIRLGNIDLEHPDAVPLDAPPGNDLPSRTATAPLPRAVVPEPTGPAP
jgi:hypothetical protein